MKAIKFLRGLFSLVLIASLMPGQPVMAQMANDSSGYQEIQILKGDVFNLRTQNLSRVSVTDPLIADIGSAKPTELAIVGKEVGQTALFIWDDMGKRTFVIRVVLENLELLKNRVVSLLESAGLYGIVIKQSVYEGKVILSGTLPEDKMKVLEQILEPFSDRVISYVKPEVIEDLVQIDMQITELSTTLSKELGVDWFTGTQVVGANGSVTTTLQDNFMPIFGEVVPEQDGSLQDLFKIGNWYRATNSALVAKVNAMITEGKAKILSKPRLVVVSGKEATFLVGGEIPIRTTTTNSSGGSTQENVEFKEYGVSMAMTPTIKDGKIDILMNVEISDIDASKPVQNDIAFLTRSAQTQLLLENRQTIVLAGMIKRSKREQARRVPLLGRIPVLGLLFRSNTTPAPNEETEVVISLTPTIIRASDASKSTKSGTKPAIEAVKAAPVIPAQPVQAVAFEPAPEPVVTSDAPVIAKSAANTVMVPEAIRPYARSVQEKISSAIAYPYEAQQNGWQGTVKLSLVIRKDGSLRDVVVKESSGYDVFDKDAINTAQILAPYDPFPETITEEQLTVTIPIVYSLDAVLKNVAKHQ